MNKWELGLNPEVNLLYFNSRESTICCGVQQNNVNNPPRATTIMSTIYCLAHKFTSRLF